MKKANKYNKKSVYVILAIVVCLIAVCLFVNYQHKKEMAEHPDTREAIIYNAKHHTVTKYLQSYAEKKHLNVKFYDPNQPLDFKALTARLHSGQYSQISLLSYYDGCPRCNREKDKIAGWLSLLAKDDAPVIAVNKSRDVKELRKHFELPSYYHYPSIFSYNSGDNNTQKIDQPLTLSESKFLGE